MRCKLHLLLLCQHGSTSLRLPLWSSCLLSQSTTPCMHIYAYIARWYYTNVFERKPRLATECFGSRKAFKFDHLDPQKTSLKTHTTGWLLMIMEKTTRIIVIPISRVSVSSWPNQTPKSTCCRMVTFRMVGTTGFSVVWCAGLSIPSTWHSMPGSMLKLQWGAGYMTEHDQMMLYCLGARYFLSAKRPSNAWDGLRIYDGKCFHVIIDLASTIVWKPQYEGDVYTLHPLILHHVLMSDSEGGELRPLRVVWTPES